MSNRPSPQGTRLISAFPLSTPLEDFDPHEILTHRQALLANILTSRLFEFDQKGDLIGQLASSVEWDGEKFVIGIKEYKTAGGLNINVEAAYYSLLRIIANDKNTHGSLKSLLCPKAELSDLRSKCDGVWFDRGHLYLKPQKSETRTFVLPLLTAPDFGVLPVECLDLTDPKRLKSPLKETSGLYYLEAHSGKEITLSINVNHPSYSERHFRTLQLVEVDGAEAVQQFVDGKIDLIPTSTSVRPTDFPLPEGDFLAHRTREFDLHFLRFSNLGLRDLTVSQRIRMGGVIKERLIDREFLPGAKVTDQYFPVMSEGHLTAEQGRELKRRLDSMTFALEMLPEVDIAVPTYMYEKVSEIFSDIRFLRVIPLKLEHYSASVDDQPHILLLAVDSSFDEDLSLISYGFALEDFGKKEDGPAWIESYVREPNKEKRLQKLRDLHMTFLLEGRIIPLFLEPFYTFARPGVVLDLSNHLSTTDYSRIFKGK